MASNGIDLKDLDALREGSRRAILRSHDLILQTRALLDRSALLLGRSIIRIGQPQIQKPERWLKDTDQVL